LDQWTSESANDFGQLDIQGDAVDASEMDTPSDAPDVRGPENPADSDALDAEDAANAGDMEVIEATCGDGMCAPGIETCCTCPLDCASCCGNGACDCGEDFWLCPSDCPCEPGASSGKGTAGQDGMVWVEIPAGCMMMGCSPEDEDCEDHEKPAHPVTVSSFEMLESEVTEAQWAAVMTADPLPSCDYYGGGGANSPVECVDRDEAEAFCNAIGGRLPTEAEWEYAARGGTKTTYYCGNDSGCVGDIAWYYDNADDGPGVHKHDVKGKLPNAYGLYDMLGNVWEWVEDCWHDNYAESPLSGYPAWTADCPGSYGVLRGGSYDANYYDQLRVSSRRAGYPSDGDGFIGFRCARSLDD
jgi:formylglycine-generating enzyme required for sulfatase activity